jgi:hypothetical protein
MLEKRIMKVPNWAIFSDTFDVTNLWHDFEFGDDEEGACIAYYDVEYQEHWHGQTLGRAYVTGAAVTRNSRLFLDRELLIARYSTTFVDAVEEAIDAERADGL